MQLNNITITASHRSSNSSLSKIHFGILWKLIKLKNRSTQNLKGIFNWFISLGIVEVRSGSDRVIQRNFIKTLLLLVVESKNRKL